MPSRWDNITPLLTQQLAKQDFEFQDVRQEGPGNSLEIEALKLTPVSTHNDKPLYLPVPVLLQVKLDNDNNIISIEGDTATTDKTAQTSFQSLQGKIQGLTPSPANTPPTHDIRTNDQGQQVIRRQRFSAF